MITISDDQLDVASFTIVYDGPGLESNEIEVRELAPALIAVADLLEEANAIINGGGTTVKISVRGSFRSGSFGIDFSVVQKAFQGVLTFFTSDGVTAANNLLGLIGIKDVGKGLIGFLQKLKNRKIQRIEPISDDRVRIHITRQETIDIDPRVLDLFRSHRVRAALENVIAKPLERQGIEEVKTGFGQSIEAIVSKPEREYFEVPLLNDELLGENITDAYLQVVSLSFKEDNKWRFSRGETVFYASIEDSDFLERIARNEIQFSKDDILKVRLFARDVLTGSGIRTDYRIVEVLEHRSAARQLRLPMDEEDDD